ncbi:MAG TPA: efflux RND transporter permease subunit, partial [Anaerolineales bacterium]
LLYAFLILLLAAVPVYFIGGEAGAFFRPLAATYALAILASMLVALTVTPALCLTLMANQSSGRPISPLVMRLRSAYEARMARMQRGGWLAIALVAIFTIAGLAVLPSLKQALLPSFKERDLMVHLEGAPGASQPEMSRISSRVSAELQAIPGVRSVAIQIGRAIFGDQVVNVNSADLWVSMDASSDYAQTAAAIQKVVAGYPGLKHSVQTYLSEKSSEVMAPSQDSLVVRVYGNTDAALSSTAESVSQSIAGVNGVVEARVKLPNQQPTFEIEVKLDEAQKYGLKPGDVRRAAATMFSGLQVGSLFEEQKVFDVVVWSTPETRQSLSSLRDLPIDTPSGNHVRLGDVADVRIVPAPSVIPHEAVKRYLDVVVQVKDRSLGAVAADITERLRQVQFPLEYRAAVLGGYAEQQAILTRFLTFALVALLGIFLLLQAAFQNWRLAAGLILTLPMAVSGGILAAFLTGGTLSLGSLVGFLALVGMAVRHAVTFFSRCHQMEREEGHGIDARLISNGAGDRLGPVLAANMATGLALSTALFFGNLPGFEFLQPMALVVLGGLVTVTLLDLFVLPALYLRFGASREAELGFAPMPQADLPATAAD